MICIKCGCPELEEDDNYCWNCGHELDGNYCSNGHCVLNNGDVRISCAEDACYCHVCGSKTKYYASELIKPVVFEENS
jgi:hypothetical protein